MSLDLKQGVAFTNLGRAFHPSYPHHRRILIYMGLAIPVTALAAWLRDPVLVPALSAGLNAALAVFVAWGLAREFDPDREVLSQLAVPLAVAGVIVHGPLPLLPAAAFVGTARFLVRITGLPVRPIEVLVVFLLPLGLMPVYHLPQLGLLSALTFLAEARFEGWPRRELLLAGLAVVITVTYTILYPLPAFTWPSAGVLVGAGLVALLMLVKIARMQAPASSTDFNDQPVSLPRLRAKLAIALLIGLLALAGGNPGFWLLAPLWAALLPAAL
jgi:hypothetical protein